MDAILLKAATLVLIIAVGYVIKRLGWVATQDFPIFSRIVLRITLPCALAVSFDTFDLTPSLLFIAVLAFGINLIQQATGFLLGRRQGHAAQAFGILNIGGYNIGLFAMPYLAGLLGHQAIAYAIIFDVGNSLAAAGIGYAWAMSLSRPDRKTSIWRFILQLLKSPIFDTYLFLLALGGLHLQLPRAVISFATIVGSANTFLAMLMIGIGLEISLSSAKYAVAIRLLAVRYGMALVFTIAMWFLLPAEPLVKVIVGMLFFAPIPSMISGFTADAGGDVELSTFMTSTSIFIGIVAMPIVQMLLSR